jgi:hypothetical protein
MTGETEDAPTRRAAESLLARFPDVLEARSQPAAGITLVRPDGYVAFESHVADAASLDHVRALLERQIA